MTKTPAEKLERPAVSLVLVMLVFLPSLFDFITVAFFDGPQVGDMMVPVSYGLRAVCSFASAFGIARLSAIRGWARLVVVALIGVSLFAISMFVTFLVVVSFFMPRH